MQFWILGNIEAALDFGGSGAAAAAALNLAPFTVWTSKRSWNISYGSFYLVMSFHIIFFVIYLWKILYYIQFMKNL